MKEEIGILTCAILSVIFYLGGLFLEKDGGRDKWYICSMIFTASAIVIASFHRN